ncbi:leucine-rich repeat domain-containing protein [Candidatus Borrarchaeum sp.]|uniref:leucine-rich repeat domain-containing protein n=1 Tax=Candidatus Borrarchaeum sp. TaxID=2846742 RepID=UPI00257BDF4E|nr:leucine-rich repeat domain-containing protein [Candidatus Borrarchaeum sp.]
MSKTQSCDYVTVRGEKYFVKDGTLDLGEKEITDINEIEGLEKFTDLKELYLSHNLIEEIKGLDNLTNLQRLNLSHNHIKKIQGLEHLTDLKTLELHHNLIEEIKGLDNLTNLQRLNLYSNQIKEIKGLENLFRLQGLKLDDNLVKDDERHLLNRKASVVVCYCRFKKEGESELMKLSEDPITCIEKPSIRVEMDIRMEECIDSFLLSERVAGRLIPFSDSLDEVSPAWKKEERNYYLTVNGITPDFYHMNDPKRLTITYRSEQDLTLRQLDDFLTALWDRLRMMFDEMRVLNETEEFLPFERLDERVIKRIVLHGIPEKGLVLEIFDKLIDYMLAFPVLERIGEEHFKKRIQTLSEAFDMGFKYESAVWAEDRRVTKALLERLDKFLKVINFWKPSFLEEE